MIDKMDYKKCTICQACINICPKGCIKLDILKEEFHYPIIDNKICIKCGRCEKVCPVLNPLELEIYHKKIYASKNLDESIRLKSTSGGVFTALAENVVNNEGIVYGAAFDNKFHVKHTSVVDINSLNMLRGSKYVQSDMGNVYNEIKEKLELDKVVLFSGCSCQVAGLKKFLIKNYENLYTVDFICHGISSQNTFNQYLKLLEIKYNAKVIKFFFREKSKGWHTSSVKVEFENGKCYTKPITEDMYMRGFLENIYLKPACHHCEFRNFKSGSDIILGDFWGAEVEEKEIDDNKGISIVIANSSKGNQLLYKIADKIFLKEVGIDNIIPYNQSLFYSSQQSPNKEKFLKMVNENGYAKVFETFCKEKYTLKCKRVVRSTSGKIKRMMKNSIKKR